MRATIGDVVRHPSWLANWWVDFPARHKNFWWLLVFDKGQGWFRWGTDDRIEYQYIDEGLEEPVPYVVAPPLRRFWWWLKQWLVIPYLMIVGVPREESGRYRFAWEEAHPERLRDGWSYFKDKDRHYDLWGYTKPRRPQPRRGRR